MKIIFKVGFVDASHALTIKEPDDAAAAFENDICIPLPCSTRYKNGRNFFSGQRHRFLITNYIPHKRRTKRRIKDVCEWAGRSLWAVTVAFVAAAAAH